MKQGESCEDCNYEEPYLFAINKFFNKIYNLCSFDRDAMSGTVHIQALRAIMKDFGLSEKQRIEFYEKAMIVESLRQEANEKAGS